jgi:hypothetical protein
VRTTGSGRPPSTEAGSHGKARVFDILVPCRRRCLLNDGYGVSHNVGMNDLPPQDSRRRLRELLAIPERDRTDEQWDEIIEIEITLAPGNRESERHSDRPGERQPEKRPGVPGTSRRPDQRKSGGRPPAARPDPRPPVQRPDPVPEAAVDGRPAEARPPRRHVRRPRRTPETPGEG